MTVKILENDWGDDNVATSIKFFAESIIELTNRYSAASYRHRTLSTVAKAEELRRAVGEVASRIVKKPYLTPMIEEYSHSLSADPIVAAVLSDKNVSVDILKVRIDDSLERISAKLALFFDLVSDKYYAVAQALIKRICGSGGREKELIRKCADHYVSYAVGKNFAREYIHIAAKREFSIVDVKGSEVRALDDFFQACDKGKRSYEILISVDDRAGRDLALTLPADLYKSTEDLPNYFRYGAFGKHALTTTGAYVVFREIPGSDPFRAITNLKEILELFHAFHFIFPNSERWHLPESACAYESETGAIYHGMLNQYIHEGRRLGNPRRHQELMLKITKFAFENLSERRKSGVKILSALKSASIASRTFEGDSRLISIWSAFEALLPHPSKDGENTIRINHFESYITPLVTASYINDTFRNLYNDLVRNFKGDFYRFIENNTTGVDRYQRFLNLFFAERKVKREFMNMINSSELLMYRCHELEKIANTPHDLKAKLEAHERRVSWQLHRIYRARNSIVHSGQSPQVSPQLTENAFSYFKSLMSVLVQAGDKFGVSDSDALFDLCSSVCHGRRAKLFSADINDPKQFLSIATSPAIV